MSFVADFVGGVVDAVSGAVDSVASTVSDVVDTVATVAGNVVDAVTSNPLVAAATIAAAVATSGASLAAEGASAAAETAAIDAWATVPAESLVSPATWSAFAAPVQTADLYANATAAAVNTSVADYAAAAATGTATGASTAFSYLPLSSLGTSVATPGFLETALDIAKGVKKTVDVIQIVNATTQQKSMVPRNAPIPSGWALDSRWNPSLGTAGAQFAYDPATGATVFAQPAQATQAAQGSTPVDSSIVAPSAGTVPPLLILAAAAAAVLYLVH